jgi:tetratricopeptide (TPR) repeat protein
MKDTHRDLLYHLLAFCLFSSFIFLLYANSLHSPFYFDDMPNIVLNPYIRIADLSWEGIKEAASLSPSSRRVLPNISFALNYYFDAYNVWGFHLVNVCIHIAAAFSFYLLARLILTLPALTGHFKWPGEIAFMAALLWAAHPLQLNAVTYLVQRMTSMAALFFVLSLYFYLKARLQQNTVPKVLLFLTSGILGIMALFSKENSGMLPIILLGCELLLLRKKHITQEARNKIIIACVCLALLFYAVSWFLLQGNPFTSFSINYPNREYTLDQRLLSQTRIIFHYMSLLILPLPGRLNLIYDFNLSYGVFNPPQTFFAIVGLLTMAAFIFFLAKRNRLIAFAIFWFMANLVVESSVIPLELIFEHRMYVPSMFLILVIVSWAYRFTAERVNLVRLACLGIMIALSFFTWQRNVTWQDPVRLWADVLQKSPGSLRSYGNLGNAYNQAKKYRVAEQYLLKGLEMGRNDKSGNFSYEALGSHIATIHENLAVVYRELKNYPKAIVEAREALRLSPSRPNPLLTLGITYSNMGNHKKAVEYFMLAWSKGIEDTDLYNNWGVSSFNLGRVDESIDLLKRAIRIDPNHPESHYNLGIAYSSKGMLEEAQREMSLAMKLRSSQK